MKLRTKLFLGTAAALFCFTQVFSGWSLYQNWKNTMESVQSYEQKHLEEKGRDFFRELEEQKKRTGDAWGKTLAREIFRKHFPGEGALYLGEEEIQNISPYAFSREAFRKRAQEGQSERFRGGIDSVLEQAGESRLLVSVFNGEQAGEEEPYMIFTYKDVTELYARIRTTFFQGLGLTALLLGGLLLSLRLWVGRMLKPFYRLQEAANEIAGGDYRRRVEMAGTDEIVSVSESFNRMADRVEEHVKALSETNARQQQLLGSLAHELKTPMMAIQGYAETLLRLNPEGAVREKSLRYIESECRRLSRLSAKMLEFTGLYRADGGMEWKELSVSALFDRVKALSRKRLEGKGQRLRVQAFPEALSCVGDEDLLISLLLNLIDNGSKASPEGSDIRLCGDETGFLVEDFGVGIPEAELSRVTEAFYMVDKSRSRREGGAGLGLALCGQIAKLHGAGLSIESRQGEGTRVRLLWGEGTKALQK